MELIRIYPGRCQKPVILALAAVLCVLLNSAVLAEYSIIKISIRPNDTLIKTSVTPFAEKSDSVYCGGKLLNRDVDYRLHHQTGNLRILKNLECDSIHIHVFRLPRWLFESLGNNPGEGKKFFILPGMPANSQIGRENTKDLRKVNLSGNKSFAFNVGQSGQSNFSQGLSIDFDARFNSGLSIRGSISDKINAVNNPVGPDGTTTLLSELDKYYFEIKGRSLTARAGDIYSITNRYMPRKRITGISSVFNSDHYNSAVSFGRPAGKFHIDRISGVDGKQGPYQINGRSGVPVSVVAGSEKIYLDGRLLEGRTDQQYVIDYAAGRVTFSPAVLITSRSRIEIDFEEADNYYQQAVYELSQEISIFDNKLKFSFGGRRELEEKDRLRFLSLSPPDVINLSEAGDSISYAFQSGIRADSAGDYTLEIDTVGDQYYQFAGKGAGEYSIQFSFVGENNGDYIRLGDNIYQYNGEGQGDFLPIKYLPLPSSNSSFYSAAELAPYSKGKIRIEYFGNDRDENLFSSIDDEDNYQSRLKTAFSHSSKKYQSDMELRYQSENFNPVYRVNVPDNNRMWALPEGSISGDEFRIESENKIILTNHKFAFDGGFLKYGDKLRSYRINIETANFTDYFINPRLSYQVGNSHDRLHTESKGLFEYYSAGLLLKSSKTSRLDIKFINEFKKESFDNIPDVEKYTEYKSDLFLRNTVLSFSRRIDFRSDDFGRKGPRLDKVTVNSEENIGRLRINFTGTFLNQKRLDSFREDRTSRLFATTFRYLASGGWLSLQADYRQNEEIGKSTDYSYIQVENGQGNYRFEDGQYFFDIDGDYIRIRQEVGQSVSISKGEKSHNITINPGRAKFLKKYQSWLNQFAFRMRSEIIEEAPGEDKRKISWIIPWTSQSGLNYVNRVRRERYTVLLFPRTNFYVANFVFTHNFNEQDGGLSVYNDSKNYKTEIKSALSSNLNSVAKYNHILTAQAGSGFISAKLRTSKYGWALIYSGGMLQFIPELEYVRFYGADNTGRGEGMTAKIEIIARYSGRGEFRLRGEYNNLVEKENFSAPEYFVTSGHRFGKSGRISLIVNYKIGKSMRITASLRNVFYENRDSEFTGRGELIALF